MVVGYPIESTHFLYDLSVSSEDQSCDIFIMIYDQICRKVHRFSSSYIKPRLRCSTNVSAGVIYFFPSKNSNLAERGERFPYTKPN